MFYIVSAHKVYYLLFYLLKWKEEKRREVWKMRLDVLVLVVMVMTSCLATSRIHENNEQQPTGGTRTMDNHHHMSRQEFNNNNMVMELLLLYKGYNIDTGKN